jgi:hypothetical protein
MGTKLLVFSTVLVKKNKANRFFFHFILPNHYCGLKLTLPNVQKILKCTVRDPLPHPSVYFIFSTILQDDRKNRLFCIHFYLQSLRNVLACVTESNPSITQPQSPRKRIHNTRNNDSNITICGKNNVNYNTFMNYFKFVLKFLQEVRFLLHHGKTNYNSFKTTTYIPILPKK